MEKYQPLPMPPKEIVPDKKMRLTVDDCAVTLNFSPNPQDSIMTEVKRMILSGHAKL